ncbi:malto-oligosyltrehalose trehalohydrolase [Pseudaminobacter sp. NGMCC 1.201702]|uniref:malto-oligosyltrehalose trehalohydrolase n=1 Tax=Pseudaminobacter sp. NGMCC 1.201702 TaxID=3391825 RepID=UPI0039EEC922
MNALGSPNESRAFPRSWGAEFVHAGEVRFRVWAPGAKSLALRLGGADTPMTRDDDGWFELMASGVDAGAPYCFVLPDLTVVPDPAARAQTGDVHGPSIVVDPTHYPWKDVEWGGRPWEEAVIYELHVGTFTAEGTFSAAIERLPYLADLGVTAVEIMPVAQFAGERGWGYDGVLLYAPHRAYGSPEDMKTFIDAAHAHGLMVLLDVVYNHFGPDGNYLSNLAPAFFHPERHTPWGSAIAYEKAPVRRFFVENALYWLEEFHLDGLRFDAIDQIRDPDSATELLVEIAELVRAEFPGRHIHLTTEDNRNATHLHQRNKDGRPLRYTAEWNDDFHNAAHVLATGETDGYYEDFADHPAGKLARALAEGFVYQGQPSAHGGGLPRGEPCRHLPPSVFIDFLQNHDQVGNRALGERLSMLADEPLRRVLSAVLLLSPHIPLLFMGEEFGETRPFYFFTDFQGELAAAVCDGRRLEFAKFAAFANAPERVPDPNAEATFEQSKIDWKALETENGHEWLAFTRKLLKLRRLHIVPLLGRASGNAGRILEAEEGIVAVDWNFAKGRLQMRANFTAEEKASPKFAGNLIFAESEDAARALRDGRLPGRSIVVAIEGT